jgi:hypothetical protein
MHKAADQDDAAIVARLAPYVTNKIAQEIEWRRISLTSLTAGPVAVDFSLTTLITPRRRSV